MLKFKKKSKWATSFYKTIQWSGFKNKTMTRGSQAAAVSVIEEKKNTSIWVKMPFMRFLGVEEIFNQEVAWKRSRT